MQWQSGERVIVWPPEAKVGDPCYPKPTYAEIAAGGKCIPE
jgi:hypothetical protein